MTESVVLITGSSSGFGRLIAEALARKGYRVFASMRDCNGRNAPIRDALRAEAEQGALAMSVLDLDVTRDESVESAVAQVISEAGQIDVLVNNAGLAFWGLTEAFTVEQARRIFETNFFGAVRMNRAVLPHMRRRRKGLVIHITSGAGRGVLPGMGLYTATKFALEGLAECYRYELSQLGIDSLTLEPGPYPTDIFAKNEPPADPSRAHDYGPMADVPQKIYAGLAASTADSHEVAEAVLKLIEMSPGTRPMRTLVGPIVTKLAPINDAAEQIERDILTSMGLGHVLHVGAARSHAV